MDIHNLHIAKVVDNNDEDQEDKIQVVVEYLHEGFNNIDYPWARPFFGGTGGATTHGVSMIPEVDSFVWVFFEKPNIFHNPFYIGDARLKNINPSMSDALSDMGSASEYPNTKFISFKNGTGIIFDSSDDNPELALYHPDGHMFIDKDGKIIVKSNKNIELTSGSAALESMILGETLKGKLEDLIDKLMSHTHGTPFGPTTPLIAPEVVDLPILKTSLSEILSQQIKNN